MKFKLIIFAFGLLMLGGCSAMDTEKEARNLDISYGGLEFDIFENGNYWGDVVFYEVDKTIAHTNNSGTKFREDVVDLEYVKFIGDNLEGELFLKWPDENRSVFIAKIPFSYWKSILGFTEEWNLNGKFVSEIRKKDE